MTAEELVNVAHLGRARDLMGFVYSRSGVATCEVDRGDSRSGRRDAGRAAFELVTAGTV